MPRADVHKVGGPKASRAVQCGSHQQHVVVQSLSHVHLFATPWIAAHQTSLSFAVSWRLLKLMSIELVMLSNHLILCLLEFQLQHQSFG